MVFKNKFKSLVFPCLSFVEDSSVACELPDSIIQQILLLLPVMTIIRCRRVCKAWYRLILDPYFAKLYFNNWQFNAIAITQQLFDGPGSTFDPANYRYCYTGIGRNGDVIHKPLNLKPVTSLIRMMTKKKTSWKNLIGSCDGLLCLTDTTLLEAYFCTNSRSIRCHDNARTNVCIVNPLTGEYMALPKFYGANHDGVVYGFGSTADGYHYKVVRVALDCSNIDKRVDERMAAAHILTIGVDKKWREVDVSSMPLRLYSHGVILNGVLHWIGDGDVVYAFDILKEKGQCFKLPSAVERKTSNIYLGVWNGHLCITDRGKEFQIYIWTMKQYGLVNSWSRDIVLNTLIPNVFSENLIQIATMRNGHLLLSCRFSGLLSCDPKTMKCVEFEDFDGNLIMLDVGYDYTPSFVSPRDVIANKIPTRSS